MVSRWTVTLTCSTIAAPAETQPFRSSSGMASCFPVSGGPSGFPAPFIQTRRSVDARGDLLPRSSRAPVIGVLLVEDDPGDVLMTTEAFEMSPVHSILHVVSDGEQALRFLRRTGEFTGAPRPGLILLDLNLPRRNGLEVLAELKADPDLLTIPVVIFSTSQAETDIAASYQLHANAYITKPVSLDLFTEAIRQVDDFFLTLVKLPAED